MIIGNLINTTCANVGGLPALSCTHKESYTEVCKWVCVCVYKVVTVWPNIAGSMGEVFLSSTHRQDHWLCLTQLRCRWNFGCPYHQSWRSIACDTASVHVPDPILGIVYVSPDFGSSLVWGWGISHLDAPYILSIGLWGEYWSHDSHQLCGVPWHRDTRSRLLHWLVLWKWHTKSQCVDSL